MAVPTFKTRSRTQASRLDHILVSQGVLDNIKKSSVNIGRSDSDHHPIETILRVHVRVAAPVQCVGRPISRVHWRPSARNDYTDALVTIAGDCLAASENAALDGNVCVAVAALEKGMLQAAEATGMPARVARRHYSGRARQPFYDAECHSLKRGLRICTSQGTGREELRNLERHYHTIVRGKRRAHRVQRLKLLITEQHQGPQVLLEAPTNRTCATAGIVVSSTAVGCLLAQACKYGVARVGWVARCLVSTPPTRSCWWVECVYHIDGSVQWSPQTPQWACTRSSGVPSWIVAIFSKGTTGWCPPFRACSGTIICHCLECNLSLRSIAQV